jgi:hypothetical protein
MSGKRGILWTKEWMELAPGARCTRVQGRLAMIGSCVDSSHAIARSQ